MVKQIRIFIGLILLFAAVSGFAQAPHSTRFKIPFTFMTAGKEWPAGDYVVQFDTFTGFFTLARSGNNDSARMTTFAGDQPGEIGENHLRFQNDGQHWILREVVMDGRLGLST
jgi:hypothetical protein